jgi:cyclase
MMPRIIARLDVKRDRVVKGISMQGERNVGDPHELAVRYYEQGADELLFVDTYASLVGRNSLGDTIRRVSDDTFVPLTVAGGIRSEADVREALQAGADRVGVNTAAIRDPSLLRRLVASYGASTIVLLIDAVENGDSWECLTEYGREPSGVDAVEWAHANDYVGEVMVTTVSRDGTVRGPDLRLVEAFADLSCPLTYAGGIRDAYDIAYAIDAGADAVGIGAALHFGCTITQLKDELRLLGREVRV